MDSRICKECGRVFLPRCGTQIYCSGPHTAECRYCGKLFEYVCSPREKPKYCSKECINKGREQTVRDRYGVHNVSELDSVRQKISDANSSDIVATKRSNTCMQRYGVKNVSQSDEVRSKLSQIMKTEDYLKGRERTCLSRYGYSSPMQCQSIKDKRKSTCIEKYGMQGHPLTTSALSKIITDPSKIDEYIQFKANPKDYILKHYPDHLPSIYQLIDQLGVSNTPIYNILINNSCNDLICHNYSNMEDEVTKFIQSLLPDIVIERNNRKIIAPQEIDIYLPEYQIGIECNPASTHNSSIIDAWGGQPKHYKYHQNKSFAAQKADVFLFHIFGYEWVNKKDIMKSMIANLLHVANRRLNGRDTYVCEISGTECKTFLNNNHRQGYTTSKVRLGLRLRSNDELVSVMTFGHMRNTMGKNLSSDEDVWELSRFCSLINTSVRGAGSKLFKAFLHMYNPNRVVSFSDIAHTTGKLYSKLGFNYVSTTSPSYVWSDIYDNVYYHRVSCQKQYLKRLLNDQSIDINDTERHIMESHKFVRLYDSGVIRWEYTCE